MSIPYNSKIVVQQNNTARVYAYRWTLNVPFDQPYHDLQIDGLLAPGRAVVTLQAQQPDGGEGHTDIFIPIIVSTNPAFIRVRTHREAGMDYGNYILNGIVVDDVRA